MRLFVLTLLFFPFFANAADCPLGPRENALTLTRVMRNFGSFTLSADSVATLGQSDSGSIKEADLQTAVTKLQLAEACAFAVVHDDAGKLLPLKAEDLKGAARDAYIKLFHDTMQDFLEGLQAYEAVFREIQAQAPALRNYADAVKWSKEIDDRATRAHGMF
jgi:hypothetical protein